MKTKKIEGFIVIFFLVLSIISIISLSESKSTLDNEIYDCSTWSSDDSYVDLGVSTWPLLNNCAFVTGFKSKEYICKNSGIFVNNLNYISKANLTHRSTRGLGVKGSENDEIDSVDTLEFIQISFREKHVLKSFEVRSLFKETYNFENVTEKADILLFLDGNFVNHFTVQAEENIGTGNGTVFVDFIIYDNASSLIFNKIIFGVNPCNNYSSYSEFSLAKLETNKSSISFIPPLIGVDCDQVNIPPVADAGGPYKGVVKNIVTLNGSKSYDPDGEIAEYIWSYYYLLDEKVVIGPGQVIDFIPEFEGEYKIELKIIDDKGEIDISTTSLEVKHNIDPFGDYDSDSLLNCEEDLNGNGDPRDDDSDSDGIPNYLDKDDDNDTINTIIECEHGEEYSMDVDEDNIPNYLDLDSDNDTKTDEEEGIQDNDGDGIPNYLDFNDEDGPLGDLDNDGVINKDDNCPEIYNPEQGDNDSDGIGDACDPDDDNDGIPDEDDDFPNDQNESVDSDGDGVGDNSDNCPDIPNPDQNDSDGDGIGDVCDPDDDNDGWSDEDEEEYGTDPTDPEDYPEDSDGDGIIDEEDNCPGIYNPDQNDTDSDGIGDVCDLDDDGDGIPDEEEIEEDTDPTDPEDPPEDTTDEIDTEKPNKGPKNPKSGYVPPANKKPIAKTNGPYEAYVDEEIMLNAAESNDPDGEIVKYVWEIDDKTILEGKIVIFKFDNTGLFNITLEVTDNKGLKDKTKTQATISNKPNNPPSNVQIIAPDNGTVNRNITIKIKATDKDSDKLKYIIEWGDKSITETSFSDSNIYIDMNHIYKKEGKYTIKIKASDDKTFSKTTEHDIRINKVIDENLVFENSAEEQRENIFWPITGFLTTLLIFLPLSFFYRRKIYE